MCDQSYQLLYTIEPPFVHNNRSNIHGVVYETLLRALSSCCGGLPTLLPVFHKSQESMMRNLTNNSFALPVSYTQSMLQSNPSFFVRVIDSPGMSIIAPKPQSEGNLFVEELNSVWPLLVLMLLLVGYAALVLWLAELPRDKGDSQLPKSFISGYFESFYCAVITATTVGYGDVVPKTVLGKIVVTSWAFIGLAVTSAFTASLTTLLTSEQVELSINPALHPGERIGVITGSLSRQLVIQAGSLPIEGDNFTDLHNRLHTGEITGILMNHYYCSFITGHIPENFVIEACTRETISTGFAFYSRSPASAMLRECLQEYALLHTLEIDWDLFMSLTHRRSWKDKPVDMASLSIKRLVGYEVILYLTALLAAMLCFTGLSCVVIRFLGFRTSRADAVSNCVI